IMPRPSNRSERRHQIVDGLMEVLPAVGYERASIARIAKAAQLSPGLVHHHFERKQEILLALAERLVGIVDARIPDARTPRRRLFGFLDAHLALGADADPRAVACWVALGAEAVFQPEVGAVYRDIIDARRAHLHTLLREVCRDEHRSTRGLDAVAAALLASVEGFFQLATAAPSVVPPGTAAPTLRSIATKLLDAQSPLS
ncbi:MAG: TetR family transcriptional regulator C-terminal domain-containing protein, partial [Myxococcota bacterium]